METLSTLLDSFQKSLDGITEKYTMKYKALHPDEAIGFSPTFLAQNYKSFTEEVAAKAQEIFKIAADKKLKTDITFFESIEKIKYNTINTFFSH